MRGTDPTSYPQINHRIAIFNEDGEIHDVYSQSDLVRFIYHKSEALGPLGECTLSELGIAVCPPPGVASVGSATLTVEAFMAMRKAKVSSLAVVDKEGLLVRGGPARGRTDGARGRTDPAGRSARAVAAGGARAGQGCGASTPFGSLLFPCFQVGCLSPSDLRGLVEPHLPVRARCPLSAVRCPLSAACCLIYGHPAPQGSHASAAARARPRAQNPEPNPTQPTQVLSLPVGSFLRLGPEAFAAGGSQALKRNSIPTAAQRSGAPQLVVKASDRAAADAARRSAEAESEAAMAAPRVVSAQPGSTLREVIAMVVGSKVHRVFVTDAGGKPVGVVTLTDIIRVAVSPEAAMVALQITEKRGGGGAKKA